MPRCASGQALVLAGRCVARGAAGIGPGVSHYPRAGKTPPRRRWAGYETPRGRVLAALLAIVLAAVLLQADYEAAEYRHAARMRAGGIPGW